MSIARLETGAWYGRTTVVVTLCPMLTTAVSLVANGVQLLKVRDELGIYEQEGL